MKIIAFSNQKGGVAKSTSVINLAGILGELGKKILVVDLDPQSNATQGLSVEVEPNHSTIYDCLVKDRPLNEAIYQTNFENIDIVPATLELANAELEDAGVFSLTGVQQLLKIIYEVKSKMNPRLKIAGVIFTKVD